MCYELDEATIKRANEIGADHVIEEPEITQGQWFEDPDTRALYIVTKYDPANGLYAMENHGPDDEIMDRINELCRDGVDEDPAKLAEILNAEFGLEPIADVLKRWEPTMGYYHA